jgi:hypothetical protein
MLFIFEELGLKGERQPIKAFFLWMHREQLIVLHPLSRGFVFQHSSLTDLNFWWSEFKLIGWGLSSVVASERLFTLTISFFGIL